MKKTSIAPNILRNMLCAVILVCSCSKKNNQAPKHRPELTDTSGIMPEDENALAELQKYYADCVDSNSLPLEKFYGYENHQNLNSNQLGIQDINALRANYNTRKDIIEKLKDKFLPNIREDATDLRTPPNIFAKRTEDDLKKYSYAALKKIKEEYDKIRQNPKLYREFIEKTYGGGPQGLKTIKILDENGGLQDYSSIRLSEDQEKIFDKLPVIDKIEFLKILEEYGPKINTDIFDKIISWKTPGHKAFTIDQQNFLYTIVEKIRTGGEIEFKKAVDRVNLIDECINDVVEFWSAPDDILKSDTQDGKTALLKLPMDEIKKLKSTHESVFDYLMRIMGFHFNAFTSFEDGKLRDDDDNEVKDYTRHPIETYLKKDIYKLNDPELIKAIVETHEIIQDLLEESYFRDEDIEDILKGADTVFERDNTAPRTKIEDPMSESEKIKFMLSNVKNQLEHYRNKRDSILSTHVDFNGYFRKLNQNEKDYLSGINEDQGKTAHRDVFIKLLEQTDDLQEFSDSKTFYHGGYDYDNGHGHGHVTTNHDGTHPDSTRYLNNLSLDAKLAPIHDKITTNEIAYNRYFLSKIKERNILLNNIRDKKYYYFSDESETPEKSFKQICNLMNDIDKISKLFLFEQDINLLKRIILLNETAEKLRAAGYVHQSTNLGKLVQLFPPNPLTTLNQKLDTSQYGNLYEPATEHKVKLADRGLALKYVFEVKILAMEKLLGIIRAAKRNDFLEDIRKKGKGLDYTNWINFLFYIFTRKSTTYHSIVNGREFNVKDFKSSTMSPTGFVNTIIHNNNNIKHPNSYIRLLSSHPVNFIKDKLLEETQFLDPFAGKTTENEIDIQMKRLLKIHRNSLFIMNTIIKTAIDSRENDYKWTVLNSIEHSFSPLTNDFLKNQILRDLHCIIKLHTEYENLKANLSIDKDKLKDFYASLFNLYLSYLDPMTKHQLKFLGPDFTLIPGPDNTIQKIIPTPVVDLP